MAEVLITIQSADPDNVGDTTMSYDETTPVLTFRLGGDIVNRYVPAGDLNINDDILCCGPGTPCRAITGKA